MKNTLLTTVIVEILFLGAATASWADDLPAPNSKWREAQRGTCVEITQVSEPMAGPDGCAQIAGQLNGGLVFGYACKSTSEISFFSGLQTDNSIRPDIVIGRYGADGIIAQYCAKTSNESPPDYNCKNEVAFKSVDSCSP